MSKNLPEIDIDFNDKKMRLFIILRNQNMEKQIAIQNPFQHHSIKDFHKFLEKVDMGISTELKFKNSDIHHILHKVHIIYNQKEICLRSHLETPLGADHFYITFEAQIYTPLLKNIIEKIIKKNDA